MVDAGTGQTGRWEGRRRRHKHVLLFFLTYRLLQSQPSALTLLCYNPFSDESGEDQLPPAKRRADSTTSRRARLTDDRNYWHHRGPGKDIYPAIRFVAPELHSLSNRPLHPRYRLQRTRVQLRSSLYLIEEQPFPYQDTDEDGDSEGERSRTCRTHSHMNTSKSFWTRTKKSLTITMMLISGHARMMKSK